MKEIIIKCNKHIDIFYKIKNDIDYLRCTDIVFKVDLVHHKIVFPLINIILHYVYYDIPFNCTNTIIDGENYSIKEICNELRGDDNE